MTQNLVTHPAAIGHNNKPTQTLDFSTPGYGQNISNPDIYLPNALKLALIDRNGDHLVHNDYETMNTDLGHGQSSFDPIPLSR